MQLARGNCLWIAFLLLAAHTSVCAVSVQGAPQANEEVSVINEHELVGSNALRAPKQRSLLAVATSLHREPPDSGHAVRNQGTVVESARFHGGSVGADPEPTKQEKDGAKAIAVGLVASAVLIPIVVHMALSESTGQVQVLGNVTAKVTLKMLDVFIAIFISVVWFTLISSVLELLHQKQLFYGCRVTVAVVTFVIMYLLSMFLAYMWRDGTIGLLVICSFAPHCIAFAGINAGFQLEGKTDDITGDLSSEAESGAAFVAGLLIFGVVAIISVFLRVFLPEKRLNDNIASELDHMEMDAFGMVTSFMATRAVCTFIVGHHVETAGTVLLAMVGAPHDHHDEAAAHNDHAGGESHGHGHRQHATEIWQMVALLGWAAAMLGLSIIVLPRVEKYLSHRGYWWSLAKHTIKVMMVMMVAWAFLLGAEWCFFYIMQGAGEMFVHMLFAIISTICVLVLLKIILLIGADTESKKETQDICLTGASLVAAWSWEECFNAAIQTVAAVYQVGFGGLVPKLVLSILLPAVLLPTYISHIKPRIERHAPLSPSPARSATA